MKKSIGSKRAVICLCSVLVAVSAFFYVPMDVEASSNALFNYNYSVSTTGSNGHFKIIPSKKVFLLDDSFDLDLYYKFDLSYDLSLQFNIFSTVRNAGFGVGSENPNNVFNGDFLRFYLVPSSEFSNNRGTVALFDGSVSVVCKGSDLYNKDFLFDVRLLDNSSFAVDFSCNIDVNSITPLTGEESETYQQGYNAGYSAGEQVGESNGYSNGYSDGFTEGEQSGYDSGFQAGSESVDTESYYDAGYNAGYNAGYSSGYDEGYDEGYSKALKAVQGSAGQWGSPMFVGTPTEIKRYGQSFYVSSYGLLDMEEYQSGVNGYFYNTVPGTYDGYTTISYNIPFYSFNNGLVKIDSDKFQVDFGLRNLDISVECDDGNGTELANLFESRLNEVYLVYNGRKYYGNYDIGTGYVEFDFIAEGVGNPTYLNTGSMTLCFDIHNTVTLVTDADVSHFISAKYYNVLECSLGIPSNSYAIYIRPYLENDRVSANIQDQTGKITGSLDEQKEIQQGQLEEQKEQTETQKGIAASIKEFFGSFFDNLINSIIHVIVPTKEEMGELFNRLNDFFSETFGFLYYPFEFIINAFNIFLVADSGTGLTLPGFSIMGYEVWGNQTYDIASEPIVGEIFGFVRMGTGAMLVMWFVNFLKDFFDKRFGGGGN